MPVPTHWSIAHSASQSPTPEVTVVIPTRDRWERLGPTLTGALRQEQVELEVVVVDDGSQVPAPEAVAGLAEPRVSLIRAEAPRGVAAARNAGIAHARGDWIAFLDDDDLWSPRKLRTQVDAARAADAIFAYGSAIVVDTGLRPLASYPAPDTSTLARDVLRTNGVPAGASNVVARAAAVRDLGGFDESFAHLDDWDLWVRLSDAGPAAAAPDVLVAYVQHEGNRLLSDDHSVMREFRQLSLKHRELARRRGTRLDGADFSRWVAHAHRRAGRRASAARVYMYGAIAYRSPGNIIRALGTALGERAMQRFAPPPPGAVTDPAAQAPDWLARYE
jgi:glycosyltransferase involved in cell wall biosynthesis